MDIYCEKCDKKISPGDDYICDRCCRVICGDCLEGDLCPECVLEEEEEEENA